MWGDEVAAFFDVGLPAYLPSPMWVTIDPSVVKHEVIEISALYAAFIKNRSEERRVGKEC